MVRNLRDVTVHLAVVLLGALLLVVGALVAVPTVAAADEAVVETAPDGTVSYADPALDDASTQRVAGTLYDVAVESGPEQPPVLVTDDGAVVPLDVADPLGAPGGRVVAELVDGPTLERALDGGASAPVAVASAQVEQAAGATAAVAHRVYVAIVTNAGAGAPAATSTVEGLVDRSTAWWTAEAGAQGSFARAGAATVRYASSLSSTQRCGINAGTSALWNEAAARFPGVGFGGSSGNHLVVVVDDDGCDGTGIGTLGGSFASGGMVTMIDNPTIFAVTADHELGHNVGLEHANAPAGEYYDLYSVMGLATSFTSNGQPVLFSASALESSRRDQLGLDDAGEIQVVEPGTSASYQLAPRGAASGLRGLEVRRGGTSHWVDWRSGTDRDDGAFYDRYTGTGFGSTRYNPGVTITTRATGSSGETELQTITVGSERRGARTAGQTYTAGDLTITVSSISATTATVAVQNGSTSLPALPSATPTIAGTPVVDGTLAAGTSGWESGATFTYQWKVAGIDVANTPTFSPRPADVGKAVTVSVTGSKSGFASSTRESAPTSAVVAGTLAPVTPTVAGTPVVDGTLTASTPAWGPGTVALARQWRVGGVDVPGATGTTFTPRAEDVGKTVVLRVTGTRSGYTTQVRDSAATGTVAAGTLTAPTPTISGTAAVGSTLTVSTGTWGPAPVDLARQWRVGGVDVAGATGATFVPRAEDVGRTVTVRVTGTRTGYTSATRESAPTSAVTGATVPTRTWRSVSAGALSTCAVDTDRGLFCWGENASGRLGDGSTTDRDVPTRVGTSSDLAGVSVGGQHACAVTTGAQLFCWGENGSGQLGLGSMTDRSAPTRVGTKADWASVSAGAAHTCATKKDGRLYCWGSNGSGRVGDGTTTTRRSAVQVGTKADWASVSAGSAHTCAVKTSGARYCWGANASRQLGSGTTTATKPRAVGSGIATVAVGDAHSCSLSTTARLACWGANASGQVGTGRTSTSVATPTSLGTGSWTGLDGGTAHTCAIGRSGRLSCWGSNGSGRLGDGTTTARTAPTVVGTATSWSAVSAGGQHTCAVRTDASLYCWGAGSAGQLGQGDATGRGTPTPVG